MIDLHCDMQPPKGTTTTPHSSNHWLSGTVCPGRSGFQKRKDLGTTANAKNFETVVPVEQVLKGASVEKEDIDKVVLALFAEEFLEELLHPRTEPPSYQRAGLVVVAGSSLMGMASLGMGDSMVVELVVESVGEGINALNTEQLEIALKSLTARPDLAICWQIKLE
ncbi:hypothetical protein BD779DRAFT_1475116 [Infundibulicybe gibba]|nr:hypothetical protein BD779DRAFT_1475116 [Infundibulicybe gibba]